MPKYRHFLFITKNYELGKQIAKELWERKKSWCVVSTDNIFKYDVKRFMSDDNYKLMIITQPEAIVERKVNDFIKFCDKYNTLPIFVTDVESYKGDMVHTMYVSLEEVLEDSFEYIHNSKDDESYKYMLDLLTEYLW